MFQSPLKTVAEKIKPVESKSSVSSLKFDRASDFKKFINFLKNETKELEKIKLPTTAEVKPKSKRGGALGLLGLGLFGLLGAGMGGGGEKDDKFRIGGTEASGIPTVPAIGLGTIVRKTPIKLATKEGLGKDAKGKSRLKITRIEKIKQIKTRKDTLREYFKRKKRLDDLIAKNNYRYKRAFNFIRNLRIKNARRQLGLEYALEDFEVQQILDREEGKFPGQMDQELAKKISDKFEKKGRFFIDENLIEAQDPEVRKAISSKIGFFELQKQLEKPITLEDAKDMEKLAKPFKGMTAIDIEDMKEARIALNLPEYKTLLKEDKFKKVTGVDTPKASSFFGGKFTPKYALDDIFTGIGEKTKGFRDFMSRPFMKGQKPTGLGKALMPAAKLGGNILRFGGAGFDVASFIFQAANLIDGFIVGDNILTAYYDLGVAFHNMFEPDKTKLAFYITKSRDARKNALVDKKNQKILEQINKAKAAQSNTSNQVSSASQDAPQGGIIPFAKGMVSTAFSELTLSPPIYSLRLITEKLYKQ